MSNLPFYIVPLTHSDWEAAASCAKKLPGEALPEIRLDLFPDADAERMVDSVKRKCIVSCRRARDGGRWPDGDEAGRLERLQLALKGRPHWFDLEWDLEIPPWLDADLMHTRLLRSFHAPPGVLDVEGMLRELPKGDAYKWVGHAIRLADNAAVKSALAWAKNHRIILSAFLMGEKGIAGRCMQSAWGGSFTYAAPNDAGPSAPGQLSLDLMMSWRCHRLHQGHGICGVVGSPVRQSAGPAFHNLRFQRFFKDLIYLPLEAASPEEVLEAAEALPLLGVSVTMPLKESLAAQLNCPSPINTIWRRSADDRWQWGNTDAEALSAFLDELPGGPVLVLGSGGVAKTSMAAIEKRGWPAMMHSRRIPQPLSDISAFGPVGAVHATSLGMDGDGALPFPDVLDAALPTLRWAAEWVNAESTAFAAWAEANGLRLVLGHELFEKQALAQSNIFIRECGGADG
jgi:3-dehydroquinate dehydratase/shikimate dehydrogenase